MLLKVESYHDHTACLVATLHPCLATSSTKDGILVSGGRKAGDLTFLQDKTVSRQHFVLRCLGTAKGMIKPRTQEEKDACKQSELKMCIVYENSGKAGSFVCSASPENIVDRQPEENDDDSETDDEGVSQQPSAANNNNNNTTKANTVTTSNTEGGADYPAISATARQHFGTIPVTLKRLDVGDKTVLPLEASADPILIQLGRFESTIKISWIPLRVMFSNMKQNDFETTIQPKLATIGGIRVEDTENPTHLVTEELNAGGKQIIAWAQELPMVQSTWLDKLLERNSPSDPLPNPKDYPIQSNSDNSIKFWSKNPNRELLKDFTLLSVEPGSFQTMAVAAGANLVELHKMASEDKQLKLAQQTQKDDTTIVFIAKTRKRITKKLTALGIPQVDLKRLAKSVTSRTDLPQDTDGNALSRQASKQSARIESTVTTSGRSTRRSRRTATQQTPKPIETEMEQEEDDHEEETPTTATPYETQCLLEPQMMEVEGENRSSENNIESEGDDKLEQIPEQATEPSMLTEPSELMKEAKQESPPKQVKKTKKTKALGTVDVNHTLKKANSDGWFTAAPQDDSLRQEWRKAYEKRHWDDDYLDFDITVETESMKVVIPQTSNESNWRIPPGRKRKGVKDFRKFRKNRIIKSDPQINIRFKSVGIQLLQDANQSKTLDEQERGLAEEQRIADELFRNDGAGSGRKRRRRVL
ncbi:MAG: hypothetical protein SGBAC_001853 [Bacillariaceae sp.]